MAPLANGALASHNLSVSVTIAAREPKIRFKANYINHVDVIVARIATPRAISCAHIFGNYDGHLDLYYYTPVQKLVFCKTRAALESSMVEPVRAST